MLAETICSAVSAAGLGIAALTAYRRRFLAAARITAYALVPVALAMTGLVKWAAGTAFSLTAWIGFGVLGFAWLLFTATRAVERRRLGAAGEEPATVEKAGRKGRSGRSEQQAAVAPTASAPSLGAGTGQRAAPQRAAAAPTEDFSDIEAILKKHGI
ncbi:hypothetical protein OHS33_06950 [Streptomyces sp. NBC_00536]|uniref:hypothetical protein n=1 Tax=Streptomyces sp. NBC_00536 TaxID=2975769 RepID=UPI002E7FCD7E|nr:hypothetical protein [Streptomyces sp. NBC_00536]WUC78104.1 hypothetical protein OHS33_06950 [Streptomyces sp. NBC_00536]